MADIDNLVIKITADNKEAIKGIEEVSKALKKMGNTGNLKTITNYFNGLAKVLNYSAKYNNSQARRITANIKEAESEKKKSDAISQTVMDEEASVNAVGKINSVLENLQTTQSSGNGTTQFVQRLAVAMQGLGVSTEKADSRLKSFIGKIKRIVGYRIIRGLFNQVVSGIKEGINNLILFESYMDETFNKRGTEIMNSLATSLQTVRNAVGSCAMAFLGALQPALQTVMEWFTQLINVINQFVVALQGGSTWLEATDEAYDYSKALKSVKKQLFGFDELNVLNGSNTNSGGSDYSKMFQESPVSEKITKFAETIKPLLTFIKENLGSIFAVIITGWATVKGLGIISGIINLVSSISSINSFTSAISGGITAVGLLSKACVALGAIGIVSLISGIVDFIKTGEMSEGTFEKMELGILAISLALAPLTSGWSLLGGAIALVIPLIIKNFDKFKEGFNVLKERVVANATVIKNTFINIKDGIANAIQGIINWINKMINKLAELKSWFSGTKVGKISSEVADITDKASGTQQVPLFTLIKQALGFANGGIPSYGSMFYAGEGGTAEIVGQFGGRTNVINQDQLTYSMREANMDVVNAISIMTNAIVQSVDGIEMPSIRIGDRDIYQASQRGAKVVGGSLVQGV